MAMSPERILQLLEQRFIADLEAGTFHNKIRFGSAQAGARSGTINVQGYRQIQINGYIFREHRLLWLLAHGEFPPKGYEIDHINGDRLDNRLANLRCVTRAENNVNSVRQPGISGLRGVTWFERDSKWAAKIMVGSQNIHLGYFDDPEEAHKAYLAAADRVWGDNAFHNRPQPETD